MSDLTHIDADGNAHMVEVGDKAITARLAIAEGWIQLSEAGTRAVAERSAKKGDVLTTAQLAGIQGAKRTSDLIPLCHPLPLTAGQLLRTTLRLVGQLNRLQHRIDTPPPLGRRHSSDLQTEVEVVPDA